MATREGQVHFYKRSLRIVACLSGFLCAINASAVSAAPAGQAIERGAESSGLFSFFLRPAPAGRAIGQGPEAPNVAFDQSNDTSEAYKLDVGDKLRVTVFGEMDLSGEYFVDGSGDVRLPLIGQVRAAGLALYQFEASVRNALEAGYLKNAKVSAEVINYRPFYILGQVNKPGEYAFVNGMNVLTAIALAGGYTYRASESNVFIRRKGSNREEASPADQTTKVFPGDIVRVRERFF